MTALISGELLRIRTTRSFWWTVLLGLGLLALVTVVQLANGVSTESDLRSVLSNAGIPGLLLIVLGIVGSAGEYRHGTITSSLLAVPGRTRFLVAKALAFGLAGLGVAVASAALVLAITLPWLSGDGDSLSSLGVSGGELAGILAGAAAYVAIGAIFGVSIGSLFTNQVAAVVGILIFLFILDPILGALDDTYGKFSLSGIGQALSGSSGQDAGFDLLSAGQAAAVFIGYSAVLIAAAIAVMARRDVSS